MAVQDNTGTQLFCISAKFDLNTDTLKLCIMACLTHQQGGGREVVAAEVVFEAVIGNRIATCRSAGRKTCSSMQKQSLI